VAATVTLSSRHLVLHWPPRLARTRLVASGGLSAAYVVRRSRSRRCRLVRRFRARAPVLIGEVGVFEAFESGATSSSLPRGHPASHRPGSCRLRRLRWGRGRRGCRVVLGLIAVA
jgi:hypothetical protein